MRTKRGLLIILLIALTMSCIYADNAKNSSSVLFKDIAIRIGTGRFLFDKYSEMGANFLGGMTFGLTKRTELAVEAITPIVPNPLSEVIAGFELSYCLLGDRVCVDDNAGIGLNIMLSAGLFFSKHNEQGSYLPTFVTLRLNTLTVGSPYSGRREHFLPIGIAWNLQDKSFSMFVSIMMYDNYIKGSWRDFE